MTITVINNIFDAPLPIVIEGQTFQADSEGQWSLNEIHRTLRLPESKAPSEWNNSVSAELRASGNFRKVDKVGSFADELGTIAYAMWVSTDFYLMVARAFLVMRNDAIASARIASLALVEKDQILSENMPKANALMAKAASYGVSWSEACRAAEITHPKLAKEYLRSIGKFQRIFDHDQGMDVLRPVYSGFKKGFFKRSAGVYGNSDGWKVTDTGIAWLHERAAEINRATATMKTHRSTVRRVRKAS